MLSCITNSTFQKLVGKYSQLSQTTLLQEGPQKINQNKQKLSLNGWSKVVSIFLTQLSQNTPYQYFSNNK